MSDTEEERTERIRVRAYFLWEEAGSPEGGAQGFWEQAAGMEESRSDDGIDLAEEESSPTSDPPSRTPVVRSESYPGKAKA